MIGERHDLKTQADWVESELQARLNTDTLACFVLQYLVDPEIDDRLVRPTDAHLERFAMAADEQVLTAHALHQAGNRDTELADDEAWKRLIISSERNIAKEIPALGGMALSQSLTDAKAPYQRRTFNQVVSRLKTAEDKPVLSPYGPDFAKDVALGNIVLPGTPVTALEPHEIAKIPGDGLIKRDLVKRNNRKQTIFF